MFFLLSFILLQAKAEDLSLPENFFKNSGIRSTQFVRRIDLCARSKAGRSIFLINQWEGSNQPPLLEAKKRKKRNTPTNQKPK
jgi:hypothetical protein